jgi:hypothetical protein
MSKKVRIIKDRWAARMRFVRKVKRRKSNLRHPTQMVNPNKFCSLIAVHFPNCPALNS